MTISVEDAKHTSWWTIANRLRKAVVDFPLNGDSEFRVGDWDERVVKEDELLEDANAISSEWRKSWNKGKHALLLDLDVQHAYVESSTPYHGHLLINVALKHEDIQEILDVLNKHGILQKGFCEAARFRKSTWLRTPWTKKG